MKIKMVKLALIGTLSLTCGVALAQSSGSHGDGVVKINGENRIADPYVSSKYKTSIMRLNHNLVMELQSIRDLMVRRGFEVAKLFKEDILGDAAYLYSDTLPCQDLDGLITNGSSTIVPFACTQNKITYIRKDLFESLSLRDQALGIVHERIHAFYPDHPHFWITNVIGGMSVALALHDEQQLGKRRMLSAEEITKLNELANSAGALGFGSFMGTTRSFVHPFGGGVIDSEFTAKDLNNLGENTYLSIDSRIFNRSDSSFNLQTIKNMIIESSEITTSVEKCLNQEFHDSQITHSSISGCSIVAGSTISDSTVEDTAIKDSTVGFSDLAQSTIEHSDFSHCAGGYSANNAKCEQTKAYGSVWLYGQTKALIVMKPKSKLVSSLLFFEGHSVKLTINENAAILGLQIFADDNGGVLKFKNSELDINFFAGRDYLFDQSTHYCVKKKNLLNGWAEKSVINVDNVGAIENCVREPRPQTYSIPL